MATKIITVQASPPAEATGADINKGAPLNATEFDQNIVNLRAAVDRRALSSDVSASLALKANLAGGNTFTGTQTLPGTTSIGNVSAAELAYLDGVTAPLQTQLDGKAFAFNYLTSDTGTTYNAATALDSYSICTLDFKGSIRTVVVTLPTASSHAGKFLIVKNNTAAVTITSASSNVLPWGSDTPGAAIISAANKWTVLQAVGNNWRVLLSN